MRQTRNDGPDYDAKKEREKERERIGKIRAKQKMIPKDDNTLKAEREKEKIRKINYR